MSARIFRPSRTAMQSGNRKAREWRLEYDPDMPLTVDPLMGWTSNADMKRQISLSFATRAEAVDYAERHNIPYRVCAAHESKPKQIAYADNFRTNRRTPWTH